MEMTHRMMMLMLQLGTILFAARIGGIIFERLRLPPVLGELCAGLLIGPHLLGAVPLPGLPGGLFHLPEGGAVSGISVSPELYGIGTLAAIVLLFMVGLETDIALLMRYSLAGSLVGTGGVILAFAAGHLLTMFLGPLVTGRTLGFLDPACLMMGVVCTATSVGIPARILAEKRKLDTPEGVTVLAGAVIDDVLGIILMAVVMGVVAATRGQTDSVQWSLVGWIALKAFTIWISATAIGLLAARRIGALLKLFRHRTVIAVMALGLALIVAGLFEEAGLALIIGAYITGLALSRTDLRHVILERLQILHVMLVPVFFALMGMLVDVRQMLSLRLLMVGLLFFLFTSAAKIIGCGIPPLLAGFNLRGGLRIGASMLPRGEVTLLLAGTGLATGMLSPELLGASVTMTLLSALIAPPLMALAFRSALPGVRKPFAGEDKSEMPFRFPSRAVASMLVGHLIEAFEHEGFYVHVLDRHHGLYHIRKDAAVIEFRHEGADIVFRCAARDSGFVNTAMVEVVAAMEHTVRELRRPLDTSDIQRAFQPSTSSAAGEPPQTSLRAYLDPALLCPDLQADNKSALIEELLDRLHNAGRVKDRQAALKAILDREESLSTGLQNGVAIPHARTDAVDRLICAVGLKPTGVAFDSIDGKPARIIVLILSPARNGAPYMQFMAMIANVLDEAGRAALLSCDTPEEMLSVLLGGNDPSPTAWRGRARLPRLFARGIDKSAGAVWPTFLTPERVALDIRADTIEQTLDALLDLCRDAPAMRDPTSARQAVMQREHQMSTAVDHGLALPHARTDAVSDVVCALGIHRQGLDMGAPDGNPTRIFVLTLTPFGAAKSYTSLVAGLTRALDAEGRQKLLEAATPEAALDVLGRKRDA